MKVATRQPGSLDRLVLTLVLLGLAAGMVQFNWLWRADQLIYDAQLRFWSRPPAPEILIVAIDETSLASFGRWPWRREVHAHLLRKISAEGPRAVAFDILFAEPDLEHPEGDRDLAAAIAESGRVVLPVTMEPPHTGGQPQEILPLPAMASAAAGLGHVHVELDPDGIARRLYLYEGLGEARWPHLAEAMRIVAGESRLDAPSMAGSPMVWRRERPVLIPFAGGPGHFPRLSYDQIIRGQYRPGVFRDRYVLIGTTATGLGDALPTPVSGFSHSMPGVEINANVLDALLQGITLAPVPQPLLLVGTLLLAGMPMLLFPYLSPRGSLLATAAMIAVTLGFSGGLLWLAHLWFPPVSALLAIALSYPLWSWRRLEQALRYLNQELDALNAERRRLPIRKRAHPDAAMAFLRELLPLAGIRITDGQGHTRSAGQAPELPEGPLPDHWQPVGGDQAWRSLAGPAGVLRVGVRWRPDAEAAPGDYRILDAVLGELVADVDGEGAPVPRELLEARIAQVQQATAQLQALRRIVDDSLANMADGVLICDALGRVLIGNARAGWYLRARDDADLGGLGLFELLGDLQPEDGRAWQQVVASALGDARRQQVSARHPGGRDLLVQIAALEAEGEDIPRGLVVNLSDVTPLREAERKRNEVLNFLSHDLRSPLVSLTALLELARARRPDAEMLSLLERMEGYTVRTLGLAEEFLQLARAESPDAYHMDEVDLVGVVLNAIEQVWAQAQARGIRVSDRMDVDEAWVRGDGSLLERALVNLLTNAIKYSETGGEVEVHLGREGRRYRCCVTDQGLGIPPEALPELFGRFRRVRSKPHLEQPGTGLGLAFVDTVVQRHGGEMEVESAPGRGSRFCMRLPAITPPEEAG